MPGDKMFSRKAAKAQRKVKIYKNEGFIFPGPGFETRGKRIGNNGTNQKGFKRLVLKL
jgi:hypothetical protein